MDPIIAGALIGGPIGAFFGFQIEESRKQQERTRAAREEARQQGIQNENAAVRQGFNNRRQALGLGEVQSQSGALLTSPLGEAQNSILG